MWFAALYGFHLLLPHFFMLYVTLQIHKKYQYFTLYTRVYLWKHAQAILWSIIVIIANSCLCDHTLHWSTRNNYYTYVALILNTQVCVPLTINHNNIIMVFVCPKNNNIMMILCCYISISFIHSSLFVYHDDYYHYRDHHHIGVWRE